MIYKKTDIAGNFNLIIILVFVLLFVKGLVFVFLVPMWQGPDEPTHVEYIMRLSQHVSFDKTIESDKRIRDRILSSMKKNNFEEFGAKVSSINDISPIAGPEYPPFYYFLNSSLIKLLNINDFEIQFYFIRLISMILGIGNLVFIYLIACKIFIEKTKLYSLTVVSFAGFLPQYSYMTSVANPENLGNLIITSVVFLFLLVSNKGLRWYYALTVIILLFLGHKTEATIFIALPLAIVAAWFQFGRKFLYYKSNISRNIKVIIFASLSITALIVIAKYFSSDLFSKTFIHGSELLATPYNLIKLGLSHPSLYIKEMAILFVSFWLSFGHMVYKMSMGWYFVLFIITCLSLTGCVIIGKSVILRRDGWFSSINIRNSILLIALIIVNLGAIYFDEFKAYARGEMNPASMPLRTQGRYLFPSLSAISCLFVLGIKGVCPIPRQHDIMKLLISFMIFLNIVSVFKYLVPLFYL